MNSPLVRCLLTTHTTKQPKKQAETQDIWLMLQHSVLGPGGTTNSERSKDKSCFVSAVLSYGLRDGLDAHLRSHARRASGDCKG